MPEILWLVTDCLLFLPFLFPIYTSQILNDLKQLSSDPELILSIQRGPAFRRQFRKHLWLLEYRGGGIPGGVPGGIISLYTHLSSLLSISPMKMDFPVGRGEEIRVYSILSFSPFYYN